MMTSRHRGTPFLRAVRAIVVKDLRAELRSRQLITSIVLFALLATMVFYYTLEGRPDARIAALPAVLWVIIVFSGTLGLNRSLGQEHDRGNLDGLLLAPIDRAALYYGKLVSTWLFSLLVAALVTGTLGFLFNIGPDLTSWVLVILFGTLGFAAVGTFLGSMAVHARGRETTLPILILPVALPIIMAAVNASSAILNSAPFAEWWIWLAVLGSIDAIFLGLALILFDFVVEE